MRGRTKLISLAAMLSVVIVTSMVFASGVVDVSQISLFSLPPAEPQSPGPTVLVDPDKIIKDYLNDPSYQIGNTLTVHVNVTEMVDLFSYQVNVTWNPAMLNFTGVSSYGDFLAKTDSPYGTSRSEKFVMASNVTGYASIAETVLGNYAGINGAGRLFTIQFRIIGYGATNLTIGTGGSLPTMLLDSTGAQITFTATNGYFKNKLTGDANGDKYVNSLDIGKLNAHWSPFGGAPGWSLGYSRDVDTNDDGYINSLDIGVVNANWGRSVP